MTALFVPQDSARVSVEEPEEVIDEEVTFSIYDVQDILTNLVSASGPAIKGSELTADAWKLEESKRRDRVVSRFVDSLKKHLDPPFAFGSNEVSLTGLSLAQVPTTIVFTGTEQQQAWVEAFIRAHEGPEQFVIVSTSFLAGPRGVFRDSKKGTGNRFFDTEQAIGEYLGGLKAKAGINQLVAPQVMTSPGTRASISTIKETAYVESVTMRIVEPGGIEIADPEIAILHEGVKMDVDITPVPKRAQRHPSGRWVVQPGLTIALHVRIENCTVERPIPTRLVRVGSGSDREGVQVSIPVVTRVALEADLMLEPGAGILIGGPSTEEDRDVAILISLPTKQLLKLRRGR